MNLGHLNVAYKDIWLLLLDGIYSDKSLSAGLKAKNSI